MIEERFQEDYDPEPDDDRRDEARRARHDPPPPKALNLWKPTSALQALAWQVINGEEQESRDAARVLAEQVLEAGKR